MALFAGGPGQAADQATFELRGFVPTRCEVSVGAGGLMTEFVGFDLTGRQTLRDEIRVVCNVPMEMTVSAENGALVHKSPDAGGVSVPYQLSIEFPSLGRIGPFSGASLRGGRSFDSGNRVLFDEQGEIILDFDVGGNLLAGPYADVLSVTVRPLE